MIRFFALTFLFISSTGFAQILLRDEWVKLLEDDTKTMALSHHLFFKSILQLSREDNLKLAVEVEKHCNKGNERLQLVGQSVKAILHFYYRDNQNDPLNDMIRCYQKSIELDEPYLQAEFGKICGSMYYHISREDIAVQYAISSLKLTEYLGHENFGYQVSYYITAGETLLKTGFYEEAINHLQKALQLSKNDTTVTELNFINAYNNIGLSYRYLGQHQKAIEYFNLLKDYCKKVGRLDWVDIAYKNRINSFVELKMLDSAKIVANWLLHSQKHFYEKDDRIIAYEMLGKVAIKENNFPEAKAYLIKSIEENNGSNKRLLMRAYEPLALCYEKLRQQDKAYLYLKQTQIYNDSINKVSQSAKNQYLLAKANFEREQLKLRKLAAEIKSVKKLRNYSILLILIIGGGIISIIIKKKNNEAKLKKEVALELEKSKTEIVQKDKNIDLLNEKINDQINHVVESNAIRELSQQVILTEEDWQNFKTMFEKSYPTFFRKLVVKVPGITEAEQRMAALIKIQLTTKQMASMLGIGQDSVHKSRHRLRQRLGTDSSTELENFIESLF